MGKERENKENVGQCNWNHTWGSKGNWNSAKILTEDQKIWRAFIKTKPSVLRKQKTFSKIFRDFFLRKQTKKLTPDVTRGLDCIDLYIFFILKMSCTLEIHLFLTIHAIQSTSVCVKFNCILFFMHKHMLYIRIHIHNGTRFINASATQWECDFFNFYKTNHIKTSVCLLVSVYVHTQVF